MIEMKNVYKTYPNGIKAINGMNLRIKKGEFVYIVGPSGAGKSTFIKMLYREEKPTTGSLVINNINLGDLKNTQVPLFRRHLGVVFQDFKLIPTLTVFENIAFALEVIEEETEVIQEKVMKVLEKVKISHRANSLPSELSGGEQQRVAIARAIVNNPKVLIADEPTGNLDPETAWGIMEILKQISEEGTTILMATHNKEIVDTLKKRVIAIEKGRIVRDEVGGMYGYED